MANYTEQCARCLSYHDGAGHECPDPSLLAAALQPNHSARTHHRYGPSKLNAYAACPGYLPNDGESEASREGTRLHEIMDGLIEVVKASPKGHRTLAVLDARTQSGEITISDDDYILLAYCCKELDRWLAMGWEEIHNEIRVTVPDPTGQELTSGHLDVLIVLRGGVGILVDFKFGWIPVPPAASNYQGKAYALGSFHKFPKLAKLGVLFVQPKLHKTTAASFRRDEMYDIFTAVQGVIRGAQQPNPTLNVNPYCDFCSRAGSCPALVQTGALALQKSEPLPFPSTFSAIEIRTPEDVAKACYILDRLETLLEESKSGIKAKALELAQAQENGILRVEIAPGQSVVVKACYRKRDRSVHHPALVAEALKDVLNPDQILACCDIALTKLEAVFADSYVAVSNNAAQRLLESATVEADNTSDPKEKKRLLGEAKQQAKEMKATKKEAKEIMASTLSAEGLMTRADGLISYATIRLEKSAPPLLSDGQ